MGLCSGCSGVPERSLRAILGTDDCSFWDDGGVSGSLGMFLLCASVKSCRGRGTSQI